MKICPSCKSEFDGGEVFCPTDGARLVTPSQSAPAPKPGADKLVGTVLSDRYRIIRQIGEGGMGLVYEAEHITIEKRVALKVLRDDFSGRPEVVERFKQEAKSATRIGSEHIIDISDFGVTPSGASYFAMEFLDGEDLASRLEREGQVPLERAVDIILQCCKALGAAHAKGIVHRDMKPENVFLTVRDGRQDFVKIVDFGIAKMSDIETPGAPGRKLTKTGMIFGTPEYMSPEQAAGKSLDHRVDIYALAVMLFEMLTGRVPFVGDTFMGILTQQMFEDPPPFEDVNPHVDVPPAIVAFVYRGLAKDPDERFQTCEQMAQALRDAMEGVAPEAASPAPARPPTGRMSRAARAAAATQEAALPARSRSGLAIGAAVVVLAAALGGGLVWYLGQGSARDSGASQDATTTVGSAPDPNADPASTADTGVPVAAPDPDAGARPTEAPVAEPTPVVDAGPARVTVHVATTPEGARVYVADRGEVCRDTPCSFETNAGQAITVRATRGRAEGEQQVTPTGETHLSFELRAPRGGSRPGGSEQSSGGSGGRGIGDLKIPDFARNQ
jgi:serine/threonine-protein kinase